MRQPVACERPSRGPLSSLYIAEALRLRVRCEELEERERDLKEDAASTAMRCQALQKRVRELEAEVQGLTRAGRLERQQLFREMRQQPRQVLKDKAARRYGETSSRGHEAATAEVLSLRSQVKALKDLQHASERKWRSFYIAVSRLAGRGDTIIGSPEELMEEWNSVVGRYKAKLRSLQDGSAARELEKEEALSALRKKVVEALAEREARNEAVSAAGRLREEVKVLRQQLVGSERACRRSMQRERTLEDRLQHIARETQRQVKTASERVRTLQHQARRHQMIVTSRTAETPRTKAKPR